MGVDRLSVTKYSGVKIKNDKTVLIHFIKPGKSPNVHCPDNVKNANTDT